MVRRAAGLCGLETGMDAAAVRDMLAQFSDYPRAAGWAREALAFCCQKGILSQDVLELRPAEAATRAETAQMLFRLLDCAQLL